MQTSITPSSPNSTTTVDETPVLIAEWVLDPSSVEHWEVDVLARQQDDSNALYQNREFTVWRPGTGDAALLGEVITPFADSQSGSWPGVSIVCSGSTCQIWVTGEANTSIDWLVVAGYSEIAADPVSSSS